MNVRDLKLAVVCGIESEEVKTLNKFFDDLFSNVTLDKKIDNTIYFVSKEKNIMIQYIDTNVLYCTDRVFWEVLQKYECTYEEIQEIIYYKAIEYLNIDMTNIDIRLW